MDSTKRKKDLSTNVNHETAMDAFLRKLGLYRKPIAKDGSCLFRAVAEQVFNCQTEHARLRKECIEYMKENKERFEAFVEGPFDHHLYNLKSQKQWAGQVEINALSLMYKCDVVVYQSVDAPPINATENNYKKKVILCYSNGNHYDSIYPFEHQKNLAFCQSLVFDLLYGKVLPKLTSMDAGNKPVESSEKVEKQGESDCSDQILTNGYGSENGEADEEGWTRVKSRKQGKAFVKNQKISADCPVDNATKTLPDSVNSSKLHWEIMRSLDPEGYRNIELEVWEETRKEQQQKDLNVAASIQFKKGDRCQIKHPFDDQFYTAVIDDIFEKSCKIWIPELKERKVVPFHSLKPNENNSSYRDLSGYHRKSESFGDTVARGNDDSKSGKRRRSNRNRKGSGNENFERNQQEVQDEQFGRQRGDKNNRRRRNGNSRPKDEKKEQRNQGEYPSQDQGFFEMSESTSSAFPALPGNTPSSEKVKPKTDVVANTNPATFWSKLHSPSLPNEDESLNPPVSGNVYEFSTMHENSEALQEVCENTVNIVEDSDETLNDNLENQHVFWQSSGDNKDTNEPASNNLVDDFKDTNTKDENVEVYHEAAPSLLDKVNGRLEKEDVLESSSGINFNLDQTYQKVNGISYTPQVGRTIKVMQNPARQVVQDELTSPFSKTDYEKPGYQEESIVKETNRDGTESFEVADHQTTPNEPADHAVENNHLNSDNQLQESVQPRTTHDHNHQAMSFANIHNDVISGHITYSRDPEGKDLPRDMEVLRHFYNLGFQSYLYSMNTAYSGGQPLSPVYPVMSPTAPMYTMHQPYQNQSMLVQQSMCQYPQMQVNSQEENQHQSSEERREGSSSYKQNMSAHHSPQYHQHQMAMLNMNYGQMYGQRHLYQNYNMFHSPRANFQRYPPSKSNFPRQANKKNKFYRNDNHQNMKLYNVQSGYGSDSKGTE